jgi:hypothetical protein
MKSVHQILTVKHGSHLYGTSTPQSDTDFKGVHLPSGRGILLGRAEDVIDRGTNNTSAKNTADDTDYQSYSLQKFLMMLSKGDTVATEMLFTPYPEQQDARIWMDIYNNRDKFLNRDCKGFVGYCVRQAAKYGIKGSRMNAIQDMLNFLKGRQRGDRMSTIEAELHDWSAGREHVMWHNIPNPNGSDNWHLDVCDRKVSMNLGIGAAIDIWTRIWDNYGARARAAMTNDGIDWKAVSHAVRVARQALELLQTGIITFPRPDAEELLAIKLGQLDYESVVAPLLEDLVAQVQASDSVLPEKSDHEFIDAFVLKYYEGQVNA